MSSAALGLTALVLAFVLILGRMPIAFSFGLVGFVGIVVLKGFQPALTCVSSQILGYMYDYTWTAVPMFVLMGYMSMACGMTSDFFLGVRQWFGRKSGGLLQAVILGNAAFGACCGVPVAAATTFASLSLPETRKYHYDDAVTLGCVCGSSNLSAMIPPSFPLIMFGALTATSIGRLFIGSLVPGLILTVIFMLVAAVGAWRRPELVPGGEATTLGQKLRGTGKMGMLVVVFAVVILGIYLGVFTPVEAAGIATVVVVLIGLIRRRFTWARVKDSLVQTVMTSAMVFFLVAGCGIFNTFLGMSGAAGVISSALTGLTDSGAVFMLVVSGIFLVLGCLLDAAALTVLFAPILFPIAMKLGIDPIHFGVQFSLIGTIGGVTPPFGIIVYAVAGAHRDVPMFQIFRRSMPYVVAMTILGIALIWLPDVVTWLPGFMYGE